MRYLFENYALDTELRELRRGPKLVSITPQAFDLLEYLIRNRDRVVSKDDLIGTIWGGRVISDSALTTRLNVVRRLVRDSGGEQRLIKTLSRKGVRFVGTVREERSPERTNPDIHSDDPASAATIPDRPSIAVLPFVNMSADPEQEYFADGIVEEITTALSHMRWLIVTARQSSFSYKGKAIDVRTISRELDVRYVLQGSVRRAGNQVRVTAHLIDATTGTQLWAQRYDSGQSNIFAVQDEITQAVASTVTPAILDAERHRASRKPPETLDAWEAYQRGIGHMLRHEARANRSAQDLFKRAIAVDPEYAPGYAGLAWSYLMSAAIFSEMSIVEGCALSEPLARKAMALDENDADARVRLATVMFLRGDAEGAIEESNRALATNSNCADALGVKGAALVFSGLRDEGREALRQSLRLSPRDPVRPIRLAQIVASQYLDGEYESAAHTARQVIRQYPNAPIAQRWLAAALGQLGRTVEARQILNKLRNTSPAWVEMYVRQQPPQFRDADYTHMLQGLRKAGWID